MNKSLSYNKSTHFLCENCHNCNNLNCCRNCTCCENVNDCTCCCCCNYCYCCESCNCCESCQTCEFCNNCLNCSNCSNLNINDNYYDRCSSNKIFPTNYCSANNSCNNWYSFNNKVKIVVAHVLTIVYTILLCLVSPTNINHLTVMNTENMQKI